jgi:hypothetical protein
VSLDGRLGAVERASLSGDCGVAKEGLWQSCEIVDQLLKGAFDETHPPEASSLVVARNSRFAFKSANDSALLYTTLKQPNGSQIGVYVAHSWTIESGATLSLYGGFLSPWSPSRISRSPASLMAQVRLPPWGSLPLGKVASAAPSCG